LNQQNIIVIVTVISIAHWTRTNAITRRCTDIILRPTFTPPWEHHRRTHQAHSLDALCWLAFWRAWNVSPLSVCLSNCQRMYGINVESRLTKQWMISIRYWWWIVVVYFHQTAILNRLWVRW
jgi:hypothetical protein